METRAVHAGRDDLVDLGVHAVPIDLSTTYPARDTRREAARLDVLHAGASDGGSPVYGRVANPTVARFETALAELEGCEAAVAFASGMAALSACLLAITSTGRPHVVAIRPLYGTSDTVLDTGLLGTTVTWTTADGVHDAIREDTGLVVVESPANPTLTELNLAAVATACGEVPLLVDNTFATPVLQQPARHGASLVLHSGTKFLGGHGDVLAGVVACDEQFARRLRQLRFATGGILHPLAGYLLLRGLATLPIRVRRASATAAILADRLAEHPAVDEVYYPGLRQDRAPGQMDSGGALVSFTVRSDPHDVLGSVKLFTPAVSLGSVDSLIEHPASLSHHAVGDAARGPGGVDDRLMRLSIGLECPEDLWVDLDSALTGSLGLESAAHLSPPEINTEVLRR